MEKSKININELFTTIKQTRKYLNVSAPMVRYSKLEFRKLLRKYNVDMCFTPMIVAKSFHESAKARRVEFTTNLNDKPLIAQFAACNSYDICAATELILPYVDGIDINCGCPQKWAMSFGYGCTLLKEPEILNDMIKSIKRLKYLNNEFSISIKMRILPKDIKYTIDLCRQFESCGITFLTVHGRTPWQKSSEPVNIDALKDIKKSINIPLVCNGNIRKLIDAEEMYEKTNCDGVMAARGLLSNPTLFTGTESTPIDCIQDWINISYIADENITFQCIHHHLTFMMEKFLNRKQRVIFNNFTKKQQIYNYLDKHFNIIPMEFGNDCDYIENEYFNKSLAMNNNDNNQNIKINDNLWNNHDINSDGKYFNSYKKNNANITDTTDYNDLNFMDKTIFDI